MSDESADPEGANAKMLKISKEKKRTTRGSNPQWRLPAS